MAYRGTITSLTPEQQKEFDATPKGIERQIFLEMLEIQRDFEEEERNKEAAPEVTDSQQVADEVKEEQPEPEQKAQESTPAAQEDQQDETATVEYWKKQAENLKKRQRDAESHLTPVMQQNAELRKEKQAIMERFEKLEAELSSVKNSQVVHVKDEEEDELESSYPEVSRLVAKKTVALEQKIRQELEARMSLVKEKDAEREIEVASRKRQDYAADHFARVKSIHPDAEDFVSEDKLGAALVEWAKTQPPMVLRTIEDPLSHDPLDVSFVITQFKNATKMNVQQPKQVKRPALGDIVTKAVSSPTRIAEPEAAIAPYPASFTEDDFNELLVKINNIHRRDDKKLDAAMDEAIARWAVTLESRS